MGRNDGFAGGVNVGARRGDRRPPRHPQPRRDAAARLGRGDPPALARGPRLVGLAGASSPRATATTINSAGNPVHFTGIVWAGDARRADRRGAGAERGAGRSRVPAWRSRSRSGAGSAASRRSFFMYHEDVDLSLRLRLVGETLGDRADRGRRPRLRVTAPRREQVALARAQPPGDAGPPLARPRSSCCWRRRCWRPRLALLLAALAGGWAGQKLRADAEVLAWLPRLLRERRAIRRERHDLRRRLRRRADPGPRLALHPGAARSRPGPPPPPHLLARRPRPSGVIPGALADSLAQAAARGADPGSR